MQPKLTTPQLERSFPAMCQASPILSPEANTQKAADDRTDETGRKHNVVWPLSPASAFCLLATIVPTTCYLNRGFTQWFHWAGIFYALTQWQFLESFQVVSGISICMGWYASLAYEFSQHDRFCHPLYKNMPESLMQYYYIVVEEHDNPQLDFESRGALFALAVAHLLDILAHPLLTYFFWKRHSARGQTLGDAFTWPVILAAYAYSRLWSLTHTKYNTGEFGLWYFGFDVYVMDSLDSWYPAYITETFIYASIVLWKLLQSMSTFGVAKGSTVGPMRGAFEKKPELLFSESSISIESKR